MDLTEGTLSLLHTIFNCYTQEYIFCIHMEQER